MLNGPVPRAHTTKDARKVVGWPQGAGEADSALPGPRAPLSRGLSPAQPRVVPIGQGLFL